MPQAESIPASVCINNVIITHISDKSVTKIDIFRKPRIDIRAVDKPERAVL